MQASSIPTKFPIPWGQSAGGAFIRPIPEASQVGVEDGAASLTDGFPPLNFLPVAAGGVPPFGQDANGILNQITLWSQWQAAGGPVHHDASFATSIGGYPAGTILSKDGTIGQFWVSTADDNLTDPDAAGAGWQLVGGVTTGIVTMRNVDGEWVVTMPDGTVLDTSASTTDGLQEAITESVEGGFALEVYGQGARIVSAQSGTLNSTDIVTGLSTGALSPGLWVTGPGIPSFTTILTVDSPSQIRLSQAATQSGVRALKFGENVTPIVCTTGIVVPPAEQWSCHLHAANVTFTATVTGVGWTFDSMLICDFALYGGQIVYQGNSYAVYFSPTNPVPIDGIVTISASRFYLSNVVAVPPSGTATAVIGFNVSLGNVNNNIFGSVEINGGAVTSYGVEVFGQTANTGYEQNIFDCSMIHGFTAAGIQEGVSTTNANTLRQNLWRVTGIRPGGAFTPDGVNSYGTGDLFWIGGITNEEGLLLRGVVLQSGTASNQVFVGNVVGYTDNIAVDAGSGNYLYGALRGGVNFGATKGFTTNPDGSIVQYINNATISSGGAFTAWQIPFPTSVLCVVGVASSGSLQTAAGSLTGVTCVGSAGIASIIAIGR